MWWLEQSLWLITIAGTAILACRLYWTRLHRIYPWLFTYLLVRTIRSLVLLNFSPTETIYGTLWMYTEPILWLLYVLIVLELTSLILGKFRGIATISQWAVWLALAVSIAVSLLTLTADLSTPITKYPELVYFNIIRRGLFSSLLLFILLMVLFLRWYPIPLSRNLVIHTLIFAVYFTCYAAGLLVRNLLGFGVTRALSTSLQVISVLCLGAWILLLKPGGETRQLRLRPRMSDSDEQRVLNHLDALNASLLRTTRK
ncbi:MAG: hypothetical protein IT160_08240 [Bryobacterales bacterium]|nr:hypothetical protein [Bryobacterales bacterium]